MPVLQISRQPDALAWFDSVRGQPLLAAEQALVGAAMAARPAQQPWLWLAPRATGPGIPELPRRTLVLHRQQGRFAGSLRCGLPLPLPNESIGNLVVQHALDDGVEGLLDECARVLEPGVKKVLDIRAYALRCTLSRRPLAVRLMPRRLAE